VSSVLASRVERLESPQREQARRPCRWHDGIVIVDDDTLPPGDPRRTASPLCEKPDRCPGGGLQIWIMDDDV
jgi:hypothetical protein